MSSVAETKTPKFEELFSTLPAKEQKAPATLALRNALRLNYDAHQVSKHGSYQTAISLYILAAEELAKFVSLAFNRPFDTNVKNLHVRKHKNIAEFFTSTCWVISVLEYFGISFSFNGKNVHVDISSDTELYDKAEKLVSYYKYVDKGAFPYMEDFSNIHEMENYKKALRFFVMYHREELNELKNKGFYLDIQDGTVKSSPYDIDEKMLESIQDLTDAILETIQRMIR